MFRKFWTEEAIKKIGKIEDEKARLDAVQALIFKPTIECLNDLDRRLRKFEGK